mgnify:CR=1 FL=1
MKYKGAIFANVGSKSNIGSPDKIPRIPTKDSQSVLPKLYFY